MLSSSNFWFIVRIKHTLTQIKMQHRHNIIHEMAQEVFCIIGTTAFRIVLQTRASKNVFSQSTKATKKFIVRRNNFGFNRISLIRK